MKSYLRCGIAALMIVGLAVGAATDSDARGVTAMLGQPQAPTDYTCFINNGGTVINTCSTSRQFCAVLPVESSLHTVEVTVFAPDASHNISCFAQATFRDNVNAGFSGVHSPTPGTNYVLSLPTVSVPFDGGLYACCNIAPTAKLMSFNY